MENNPGISGKNSEYIGVMTMGKVEKLINGLPYGEKMGRIELLSHSDPKKVYALIDNLSKERSNAAEVYLSTDAGKINRTHSEDLHIFPELDGTSLTST